MWVSSNLGSVYRPNRKRRGLRSRIVIYVTVTMPFFPSLVKCFTATLACSDCIYGKIFIVPTKNYFEFRVKIPFRKKSYEVSNLAFLGCSAGSPHQSVRQFSSNLPPIMNTFPLSDLDDAISDVCSNEICNATPTSFLVMK